MTLPNIQKPGPLTALSTGITNQTIANGATYTGTEIDNTTNRYGLCIIELVWKYATAPAAYKTVEIHRLRCNDGSTYEEMSTNTLIATVSPPVDTDTHPRTLLEALPLLAARYKFAVRNVDTGQPVTATLAVYAYNYQLED